MESLPCSLRSWSNLAGIGTRHRCPEKGQVGPRHSFGNTYERLPIVINDQIRDYAYKQSQEESKAADILFILFSLRTFNAL